MTARVRKPWQICERSFFYGVAFAVVVMLFVVWSLVVGTR